MNWMFKLFLLILTVSIPLARADVVRVEQLKEEYLAVSSPYVLSSANTKIYVSSGTGKSIRLYLKNSEGKVVLTDTKNNIDINDKFVIAGTTYFGHIFELKSIPQGIYTLTVDRGTFDLANNYTTQNYPFTVDLTPPTINGSFYWPAPGYVLNHTDGTFILSLAQAREGGFTNSNVGISGYSHATFTSEYIDGPNAGKTHANNVPAQLTADGRLIIGTGLIGSLSTLHIPSNTAAQMKLTFRLFSKAGLSAEKSEVVYVATKRLATKPEPVGLFTGANVKLFGEDALAGFVPYVAKMNVSTNPLRMLYRAPRSEYFGGGGDAEIYGGWYGSTRGTSKIIHKDGTYVYFDITGSTNGNVFAGLLVRDLSDWRRFEFEHDLTLDEAVKPPVATEIAYLQKNANKWFSHPSRLETYITKDNISTSDDFISKIRISVQARSYDQRFNYDFRGVGPYVGFCIVPASQTQCSIDVNLPYPDSSAGVYHNRHRITGVPNGLLSDEFLSVWYFDGAPAVIELPSLVHSSESKSISFKVSKIIKTNMWGASQIRSVQLRAAPKAKPTQRINIKLKTQNAENTATGVINSYTFEYADLPDGDYEFYAYVEDGFSSSTYRHKKEYKLLDLVYLDQTPPKINTNITAKPITSLTDIRIMLSDTSPVSLKSLVITGGVENISYALPFQSLNTSDFRPEYIFLDPSEGVPYQLTINAADKPGNVSTLKLSFLYQPKLTRLADTKMPSIASPLRSPDGKPNNVIVTPQIRNSEGDPARGVHKVYFALNPAAQDSLMVNGNTVAPGQTISFDTNLTLSNHRLRLEVYPSSSGKVSVSDFQIHVPDIRVTLCPVNFVETGANCVYLSYKDANIICPTDFEKTTTNCEKLIEYEPKPDCADGYTLDGLTCKGTVQSLPEATCPSGYGLKGTDSCERSNVENIAICPDDQTFEDGMCKDSEGALTPTSLFCDGKNVSSGPICESGTCISYNPSWNACQITTTALPNLKCPLGVLSSGKCIAPHEYDLNVSCPFGFNREGLKCSRLEIVDTTKSCDLGWQQDGEGCIKIEYAPFEDCPESHKLISGRCHALMDPIITCPVDMTWDGSTCTKEVVTPATPVCPAPYEWTGTQCRNTLVEEATPICPANHTWNGTVCLNTLIQDASPVCASGFAWSVSNGICEKTSVQVASPVCPAGYDLDVDTCKKSEAIQATSVCNVDYPWNGSTCAKTQQQVATPNCTAGYSWNGSTCTKNETQLASSSCPTGYTWNGSTCAKDESQGATPSCAAGFTWNGSTCTKNESQGATPSCASGFTWNGSTCFKDQSQGATPSCSAGFTWNGSTCFKDESQGATPTCAAGFTWNGSTCFKDESQAATPSCAAGFTWNGSTCFKDESQGATPSCASGFTWNGSTCFKDESQGATPTCAAGFTWNGSTCSRTESQGATEFKSCPNIGTQMCGPSRWTVGIEIEMGTTVCTYSDKEHCGSWSTTRPIITSYSCPSGWTVSGSTCNRTSTQAPTYSCPSGWTVSGSTCNRTSTQAPTYSCPSGWAVSGSTCNRTSTQAPTYSCPSGWTVSGSTCNRTSTQAPTYSCPSGWTVSGSTCNRTSTQAPTYSCPSGWTVSGSTCNRTSTQAPTYSCPSGWAVSGSTCNRTLTQPRIFTCPAGGWTLSSGICSRTLTLPPTYSCPAGDWVISGENCILEETQPPVSYSCSAGWDLDGTMCKRTLTSPPSSYTCPVDWTVSGSTCTIVNTAPPSSYSCPAAWTLSGQSCTKDQVTPPLSYSCQEDWSLDGQTCSKYVYAPIDSFICLPSDTLDGEQCIGTATAIETRTCLPAYSLLNPDQCGKNTADDFVGSCKSGWLVTATQCAFTHEKPQNNSCENGFTLIDGQCHRNLEQVVDVTCDTGDELDEGKCLTKITAPHLKTCDAPHTEFEDRCRHIIEVKNFDQVQ